MSCCLQPPLFQVDISRFRRCKGTPLGAIVDAGAAEHASMRHELSWLVTALLSLRPHLLPLLYTIPHAALATPLDWTTPQSRLVNNARAFQIPGLRPGLCWSYIGPLPRVCSYLSHILQFSLPFFLAVLALYILCWATSSLRIDSAFFSPSSFDLLRNYGLDGLFPFLFIL